MGVYEANKCVLSFLGACLCLNTGVDTDLRAESRRREVSPQNSAVHGTVVVGVAVAEGLVLVGDSRVTVQNEEWNPPYKVVSDSNQKVMAVGNIGVATFGQAFLLGRSIRSWVQDLAFELSKKVKLEELTLESFRTEFIKYFDPKVLENRKSYPNASVGFLVAGYDNAGIGRVYLVVFPGGETKEKTNTKDNPGMTWQGETDTIQRLILGVDKSKFARLPHYEKADQELQKRIGEELKQLEYLIFWNYLSLQDAIDLATFLVGATVTMQRFSFGTAGKIGSLPDVGGPIDSLVVTPTGLKWIHQKQLSTP